MNALRGKGDRAADYLCRVRRELAGCAVPAGIAGQLDPRLVDVPLGAARPQLSDDKFRFRRVEFITGDAHVRGEVTRAVDLPRIDGNKWADSGEPARDFS